MKSTPDKPVGFIINTHFHGDHTGGSAYFQKHAPIVAPDHVRKPLGSDGGVGNGGAIHMDTQPAPHDALPIITFAHAVTAHLSGEDIRALYFPPDILTATPWFSFPHSNVVHMDDDFVTYGFPFIEVESGAAAMA